MATHNALGGHSAILANHGEGSMHKAGSVILRKIGGVFDACRAGNHPLVGSYRAARPSIASTALSLSMLLLVPLALIALFGALMAWHPVAVAHIATLKFGGLAIAGEISAVTEARERLEAKQTLMGEVAGLAKDGGRYNFTRKNVQEKLGATDEHDALGKFKALNRELEGLGAELEQAEIKAAMGDHERRQELARTPAGSSLVHTGERKARSFGELFVEHEIYAKDWKLSKRREIEGVLDIGIKQIFSEGTPGFPPESVRTGLLVEGATRPIQILDIIPTRPINQALDKYMAETTRTHASAEKAEAAAYAESTFVWTEKTSTVQKITDSVPVTDEQLEDAAQVSGLLDQRLRFGLRQRLDLQVTVGNGTSPNLSGLTDTTHHTGIQTQAKGADPTFDATYKALTLVRFTGRATPSAFIFHPTDWQGIRLSRTTTGEYIFGNPSQPGATTLWGLPVVIADSLSQGTAITADFVNFTYIGERRGIEVQIGYVNDDFIKGKKTIRADLRACFTITRETAVCLIIGL